jgi:glycosyltransferase involved in cell wall biosynthesis
VRNPDISIVIPSFNQGKYIERTLLSILKQEYQGKVEVIVSDGGSTDNTVDVLKKYDKQITWWSEKDDGYTDAVNKGFQKATGEIFGIQSSDDYYLSKSFQKLSNSFEMNKDAVLICGREALQESDGHIFGGYELPELITPRSFLLDHPFPGIFQHTTFFRRKFYEKAGGMRLQFDICADADLFYRMLHFGNGHFLNEYIAVYQRHNSQRTTTQTLKFRDSLIEMVNSCKKDEFYYRKYCPSESETNRFQTFIRLFYLQYENPEGALNLAEEISKSSPIDKRITNLINLVLNQEGPNKKFEDNIIKKSARILNRIIAKIFHGTNSQRVQQILFSDKINANWWDEHNNIKQIKLQ